MPIDDIAGHRATAPADEAAARASIGRLCYLGLSRREPDVVERLCTRVAGLEVSDRDSRDGTLLRADDHAYRIALHRGDEDRLAYIGWEVASEQALEALASRLSAGGVEVRTSDESLRRRRGVKALVRFEDPNGWSLEACCGPLIENHRPFRSPLGFRFNTGPLGLGHVVLGISDFDASLAFYQDRLGFRVSDFIEVERVPGSKVQSSIAFLRCNARHHSVAFGSNSGEPGSFSHFMLEVTDLDHLGRAYDEALALGLAGLSRLGRHPNDDVVSFYVPLPGGGGLEIGWGGLLIDEATWSVRRFEQLSKWGHGFASNLGGAGIALAAAPARPAAVEPARAEKGH